MEPAKVKTTCATCEKEGQLEVWQELVQGRVVWRENFRCDCGHAYDAGDEGPPPPAVRQAILEQQGTYETWLDDVTGRQAAVKVMTTMLQVKEAEAAFRVVKLPARVFSGTQVEAQFIADTLKRLGAKQGVRVEQRQATQPKKK